MKTNKKFRKGGEKGVSDLCLTSKKTKSFYITMVLIFLNLAAVYQIHAQTPAETLIEKATQLRDSADYSASNMELEKVLGLLAHQEAPEQKIKVRNLLVDNYISLRKMSTADSLLQINIKEAEARLPADHYEYGACLNLAGKIKFNTGKVSEALAYFNRTKEIWKKTLKSDHSEWLRINENIGVSHARMGQLDEAIKHLYEVAGIREESPDVNLKKLATTYNNVGMLSRATGDYVKALEYLEKALDIRKKIFDENHPEIAFSSNNLGILYMEFGSYERALGLFNHSLDIRNRQADVNRYELGKINSNIGVLYKKKGQYELARKYLENAIGFVEESPSPKVWAYYNNLGTICFVLKQYEEAGINYEKANDIIFENPDKFTYESAVVSYNISELNKAKGDFKKSIKNSEFAINTYSRFFSSNHPNVLKSKKHLADIYLENQELEKASGLLDEIIDSVEVRDFVSWWVALEVLNLKTDLHLMKYKESGEVEWLESSLEILERGDSLISELQFYSHEDEDRLKLNESLSSWYKSAMDVNAGLYQQKASDSCLGKMFGYVEKSKANTLMQSIRSNEALRFSGVPENMLEQEGDLSKEIRYLESKLSAALLKKDSVKIARYERKLFNKKEGYSALINQLEIDCPEYFELKYKPDDISLEKVKNNLEQDEVLLQYYLSDTLLYVLKITVDNAQLFSLDVGIGFTDSVAHFITIITEGKRSFDPLLYENELNVFSKQSRHFYKLVLEPLLPDVSAYKRLIILPDGILHYMPFDVLLTDDVKEEMKVYNSLPYLIKRVPITYGISANILFRENRTSDWNDNSPYLGFAADYKNTELVELPAAQKGVLQLADKLGGQAIVGPAATKKRFTDLAESSRVLHLALHGILSDETPMLSALEFSMNTDTTQSAKLTVQEIYNLNVRAELVVLGACQTGTGAIRKGEGVMSIGRAFSYAGGTGMVMSLWSVPEWQTTKIVDDFFNGIFQNLSKDEALRQAKLNYLQNTPPRTAHPVFWAGMNYSGHPAPITFERKSNHWMWMLGGVFTILAFILFQIVRKHPKI